VPSRKRPNRAIIETDCAVLAGRTARRQRYVGSCIGTQGARLEGRRRARGEAHRRAVGRRRGQRPRAVRHAVAGQPDASIRCVTLAPDRRMLRHLTLGAHEWTSGRCRAGCPSGRAQAIAERCLLAGTIRRKDAVIEAVIPDLLRGRATRSGTLRTGGAPSGRRPSAGRRRRWGPHVAHRPPGVTGSGGRGLTGRRSPVQGLHSGGHRSSPATI